MGFNHRVGEGQVPSAPLSRSYYLYLFKLIIIFVSPWKNGARYCRACAACEVDQLKYKEFRSFELFIVKTTFSVKLNAAL